MPIYKGSFSVFPVYAGVILLPVARLRPLFSVPRVCGGDPVRGIDTGFIYAGVPRVCGGDPLTYIPVIINI